MKFLARCTPASLALMLLLAACGGSDGGSTAPPNDVAAKAGDAYVQVSWSATAGVEYWLFTAADATLTTLNWLNLAGGAAVVNAVSPVTLCGQSNGLQKWFTVNGRTGSAAGGPGSPVVSATPRAAGDTWTAGSALNDNLTGLGFALVTTCQRSGLATGTLIAVGPGGAIHSSSDGIAWTRRAAPSGFTTDLAAIANFTASVNVPASPGLRTIAVGAGGASIVSTDGGASWTVGLAFDASRATLRGLIAVGSAFTAVGDGGAIRSTTDGITWSTLVSNTTANLRGIAFGGSRYVAVGDNGTLVTSIDSGLTWTAQTIAGAGNLHAIAYGNNNNSTDNGGALLINTFVAVGDNGTAAVSNDGGATWSLKTVAGAGEFSAIAYTTRFAAVDRSGKAFTSATGQTWSNAIATGHTGLRALANNGIGFIAVGDGGVTATSF